MAKSKNTPQHVALIMDGNRRWATRHKLAILRGHEYAAEKTIKPIVKTGIEAGIKYLTFWAFSTENKNRAKEEVEGLLNLFRRALKTNAEELHKMGVQIRTIGDMAWFPKDMQEEISNMRQKTKSNKKIVVTFALNYGGRDEIIRAVNKLLKKAKGKITESLFEQTLDTKNLPDPDMIIRTGGEKRLSGYLPWQGVYAELYFTKTLWPDFTPAKFEEALEDYSKRMRRFGK